ncbi:ATP-dependent Clp protease ATP-binding subunit [Allofustis seminis]|uniref:ATP-dependent Clp protease ATP-binding subunit n=1 Tax=Allofustis seminis TaxID=166939 RepID=UPI00037A11E1|nr:ATP-dependent Clp protease ATP-binding subunit [Allofustis seminis]
MLCERCRQREATIHLTTSINGQKREIDVCPQCYREIKQQQSFGSRRPSDPFENFNDIFRALGAGQPRYDYGNQQTPEFGGGQVPPMNGQGNGGGGLLDEYGINLNKMAEEGKIDPIIGRDKEIDRMIQILNRRNKNNPVLIGEAGVGKTAVVEGLALKIINDDVPQKLKNKIIISLDVASLVQGTGIRGQFEERMQQLIQELEANPQIILFIDEIHQIVGAGSAEGSNSDAGNILKPALARGDIQVIGATTLDEYRIIEKDAALERRFQPVKINEPTLEQTYTIIKGIQKKYEDYHHVKYDESAIKAAIELSDRFIQDRFLPDKAIDLLDEAGSKKNLTIKTVDPEVIKQDMAQAEQQKKLATEKEDYEKAAYYRDQVNKYEEMLKQQQPASEEPHVTEADMINIIEIKTGIPVGDLKEKEQQQLRNLDKELQKHVIGQDEAIDKVTRAVRRNRIGLRRTTRPIGSFLFVGPTGVGKTELAKALTYEMFGSKDAYIRLDMSEYMEKHSTSKLIGSPPGYVGYDEAGQLTEQVRRKPYSLILVDEVEKAHPDVLNMFLQILDDGRLTDSQGRVVDFKNTIIIMTSNAGQGNLESNVGFGATMDGTQQSVLEQLTNYFKPEFLNRFDAIVEFNALTKDNLLGIVNIMLDEINRSMKQHGITIRVDDKAKRKLVDLGYNPAMGARPLRRVIEEQIEDKIAEFYLINPDVGDIYVTVEGDEIVVRQGTAPEKSEDVQEINNETSTDTDSKEDTTEVDESKENNEQEKDED